MAAATMSQQTRLDHLRFPHLVDLIVAVCDLPTKVAFRATSRAWRDKVDDTLFRHVVLAHSPPGDTFHSAAMQVLQPVYPFGRLPFVPWHADELGDPPPTSSWTMDHFDPTDPDSYPFPPHSEKTASRHRQLGRVRVVDYHPFRSPSAAKLPEYLTGLDVIRRRRMMPTGLRAKTCVDFLCISSPACHRTGHIPYVNLQSLQHCQRYILHLTYDPSHPYLGQSFLRLGFGDAKDITLVFAAQSVAPIEGTMIRPPAEENQPPLGILFSIIKSLAKPMAKFKGEATVRFVGLERFPPSYLSIEPGLDDETLLTEIKEMTLAGARSFTKPLLDGTDDERTKLAQKCSDRIEFVALDDWRAASRSEETFPCPMLPNFDEDAAEEEDWLANPDVTDFGPAILHTPPGTPPPE